MSNINLRFDLDKLLNDSIAGHILVDRQTGQCLFMNSIAKISLEVQDESVEIPISTFFSKSKRPEIVSFDQSLLVKEDGYSIMLMNRFFGTPLYCRARFYMHNTHYTHICFLDITEELKLNREISVKQKELSTAYNEIKQQNMELMALDKAKDKFISLTSHELRTPLSACIATAELLHLKLYSTPQELDEHIKTIYDQSKYLLEIVNDILDFSKIQSGRMELYIEELNIHDLLVKCTKELQDVANKKQIQLNIDMSSHHLPCYFDAIRMKQVFVNLIGNAIKFSRENQPVTLRCLLEDDFVHIHIEDKGIGISEDNLEKIFNEFETLEKINHHQNGTGLGLPITKKLLEFMGGKISVTSILGSGSAFTVSIPRNRILEETLYRSRENIDFDLLKVG